MRRLWIAFSAVLILSFAVLGWTGVRIYQEAPPIPDRVVTTDGKEIISKGSISAAGIYRLMFAVLDRLFDGDAGAMCDAVGIAGAQKEAVVATAWDRSVQLGRADLFRDASGFKLIELNVHSSTGVLVIADVNRAMLEVPFFSAFAAEQGLAFADPMDGVSAAVRAAARERGLRAGEDQGGAGQERGEQLRDRLIEPDRARAEHAVPLAEPDPRRQPGAVVANGAVRDHHAFGRPVVPDV